MCGLKCGSVLHCLSAGMNAAIFKVSSAIALALLIVHLKIIKDFHSVGFGFIDFAIVAQIY